MFTQLQQELKACVTTDVSYIIWGYFTTDELLWMVLSDILDGMVLPSYPELRVHKCLKKRMQYLARGCCDMFPTAATRDCVIRLQQNLKSLQQSLSSKHDLIKRYNPDRPLCANAYCLRTAANIRCSNCSAKKFSYHTYLQICRVRNVKYCMQHVYPVAYSRPVLSIESLSHIPHRGHTEGVRPVIMRFMNMRMDIICLDWSCRRVINWNLNGKSRPQYHPDIGTCPLLRHWVPLLTDMQGVVSDCKEKTSWFSSFLLSLY